MNENNNSAKAEWGNQSAFRLQFKLPSLTISKCARTEQFEV